jgi:hypothetical protein
MAGVAGVRRSGHCVRVRLPPPGRRRTSLFHGAPRNTHGGGTLGQLLFITAEPHSLGGGDRQHRVRRTGTWPRGLLLAKPPIVVGHTCDGDEAATETRKAKSEKGIEGGKRGGAFVKKVRMHKWYND